MKAITRDAYGGPEALRWTEIDRREPGPGEVLVTVRAASINAADVHLMRGQPFPARLVLGLRKPKHRVLGADFAGRVQAVGAGVQRLKPGDAVFGDASGHGFGAFAEEVVMPEEALALVPSGVSFQQAAAIPMAAVTALQALRDKGRLQRGQRVPISFGLSIVLLDLAMESCLSKSFGHFGDSTPRSECSATRAERSRVGSRRRRVRCRAWLRRRSR